MGMFLFATTLLLELVGAVLSYWYGSAIFGSLLAAVWNPLFPDFTISLPFWGFVFVAANILIHLTALMVALIRLQLRLHHLGAPSERQKEAVQHIYTQASSAAARYGLLLSTPQSFCFSPTRDLQAGFIGRTLVVRDSLLKSRFLAPLLIHELAHYNSADLSLRLWLSFFPPMLYGFGVIIGLGVGLGPLVMFFFWVRYWHKREFDADLFTARLGYANDVIEALEALRLPRNREKHILLRETPYSEERIDRLRRALK